jgi:hypothetical protein
MGGNPELNTVDEADAIIKTGTLLHEFERRSSMKSVRALLDRYADKAQAVDTASGSLFEGQVPETTAAELLEVARRETQEKGGNETQETLPGVVEGDREKPPGPEGAAARAGDVGDVGQVAAREAAIERGYAVHRFHRRECAGGVCDDGQVNNDIPIQPAR